MFAMMRAIAIRGITCVAGAHHDDHRDHGPDQVAEAGEHEINGLKPMDQNAMIDAGG